MKLEWLGYLAAFFSTTGHFPQIKHILKRRQVEDLSLLSYVFFLCGNLLWLSYGVTLGSPSMIIANLIGLSFLLCVLGLKFFFGKRSK